jgi:hypothetical protein
MTTHVQYEKTADGHLAARVAHLVIALIPMKDRSQRTLTAYPARPPAECVLSDFSNCGFNGFDEASFRQEVEEFAEHQQELKALGRRELARNEVRSIHNPWGTADHGKELAPGVVTLSTPGHGGFVLSPEMNAVIDPAWRSGGEDSIGFYEEHQMWAIVAHTFPDLFTGFERRCAERTLMQGMPDEWERLTSETIEPGASLERDRQIFALKTANEIVACSASRSKTDPSKMIVSACVGGLDRRGRWNGPRTLYLVDADEYRTRQKSNRFQIALIDLSKDVQVDSDEQPETPHYRMAA